jgi:hypothetical protein
MDALSLPEVSIFRDGMSVSLDGGAPDAVALIQRTGTLDAARKATLLETLQRHARSVHAGEA